MRPIAAALAVATVAISLSGCAWLPKRVKWAEIRPIEVVATGRASDAYYASAKTSIVNGRYALALEQLRAARERDPRDERVMNALGVVYDKLGRFDLSQRYYAEAAAIAPASEFVQHNMAYSQRLQSARPGSTVQEVLMVQAPVPAAVVAPAPLPASPKLAAASVPRLVSAGGNVLRLELPSGQPASAGQTAQSGSPTVLYIGSAIRMVDATGLDEAAQAVQTQLRGKGWTVKAEAAAAPTVARTTIHYPAQNAAVAQALANTLRGGADLVICSTDCSGLRLVLGADQRATLGRPQNRAG